MNDMKKGILQASLIVIMILLFVAAFSLVYLGHYGVAIVLFGILIVSLNFIGNWTRAENEANLYLKNYKNDNNLY